MRRRGRRRNGPWAMIPDRRIVDHGPAWSGPHESRLQAMPPFGDPAQRHISTGMSLFSRTCRVTPPRMSWRSREWL